MTEDLAVINQGIALSDVEKYEILLQELISIRTERAFNCHQEVLSAKYEIAEAILNSPLYQGKNSPGSGHLLKRVSDDMGVSSTEIYSSIKFFEAAEGDPEKYLQGFGWGKATTWTRLKRELDTPKLTKAQRPKQNNGTADRAKAVEISWSRIGKIWTQDDQNRIEKALNYAPDPASRPRAHIPTEQEAGRQSESDSSLNK
jgi:hypothetical protein